MPFLATLIAGSSVFALRDEIAGASLAHRWRIAGASLAVWTARVNEACVMFVKTHLGRECADRVDDALEVAYDEARLLRQAVEGRRKLRLLLLHDAVCRGHGVKVTAREGAPHPRQGAGRV